MLTNWIDILIGFLAVIAIASAIESMLFYKPLKCRCCGKRYKYNDMYTPTLCKKCIDIGKKNRFKYGR